MTCVAALVDEKGTLYFAADSLFSDQFSQTIMSYPKIFKISNIVIGYAGSVRIGQLIQYSFKPSPNDGRPDMEYICSTFVNELRQLFIQNGLISADQGDDITLNFELIIGYNGNIYQMQCDFSVICVSDGFGSIGGGSMSSNGALFATKATNHSPIERLNLALNAASYYVPSVKPPFNFIIMEKNDDNGVSKETDDKPSRKTKRSK